MNRPTSERMQFGEKLRKLREEKGWTQKQLGEMIGVNNRSVSSYESGASEVPRHRLNDLAHVFGVRLSYLTDEIEEVPELKLSASETKMICAFRVQPEKTRAKIYASSLEGTKYAEGSEFPELMEEFFDSGSDG